jgi:hypothetical protein
MGLRKETGRKAWYAVGRGYDTGVFYDEWYVNGQSNCMIILTLDNLPRLWVEPLVGPLKRRGALFRRARYGGEAEALDIYQEWETQGATRIFQLN